MCILVPFHFLSLLFSPWCTFLATSYVYSFIYCFICYFSYFCHLRTLFFTQDHYSLPFPDSLSFLQVCSEPSLAPHPFYASFTEVDNLSLWKQRNRFNASRWGRSAGPYVPPTESYVLGKGGQTAQSNDPRIRNDKAWVLVLVPRVPHYTT